MNATEIVKREMQSYGSFQVRQLLAERIRQPRESAKLHSHCEVLPFDKRSADMSRVRIPAPDSGYNLRESWWGVPPVRAIVLSEVPEQFRKLREVNIHSKALSHSLPVEVESVSGQLNPIAHPLRQLPAKHLSRVHRSLAHCECRDKFGIGIHRHKNPLISDLIRGFALANVLVFLKHKRKKFIGLNALRAAQSPPA